MSVEILTFGCRLNAYESEAIRARAAEARLENALIINTCAVTAEAVRQSRQAIRRARREQPQRRIVVTGCAAQIEPQTYAAMAEVDLVIGNSEKLVAAMKGLAFDSPFGRVTFRALDHQSTMGAYVGRTAVKDGKGVMVDWRYADGKDYLPSDDQVKRLRPAD